MSDQNQMASARKKQAKATGTVATHSRTRQQDAIDTLTELLPGSRPVAERVATVAKTTAYTGPIPHPEIFKGFGEVVADAPERILKVFELDSAHARDIQFAALKAQQADNKRTHWMAWSAIAGCIGAAVLFGLHGNTPLAIAFLSAPLLGAATSFLRSWQDKERDKS